MGEGHPNEPSVLYQNDTDSSRAPIVIFGENSARITLNNNRSHVFILKRGLENVASDENIV